MTFTYFENPLKYSPISEGLVNCSICRKEKICFDATLFYGEDQIEAICDECLAGGKLGDKDIFTAQGDIEELHTQLKDIHPDWSEEKLEEDASKKTFALEKTTPHLVTWQDWEWPCADGDYCKFIGYGSKPFYKKLANSISVEDFFENSFYDSDSYSDDLWSDAVSDMEIKNYTDSSKYSTLFYVFKSLNSGKIITIWDCD